MHSPKKVVIFDFYGVICSEVGLQWFAKNVHRDRLKEIKEKFFRPANLGDITEADFFGQLSALSGKSDTAVRGEWRSEASIDSEVVAIIQKMQPDYRLAICSNARSESIHELLHENNLTQYFEKIIVSSEVHMIKPDPEIFELTLSQLAVTPHDALFIDDMEKNVRGAEAVGIDSIQFTDASKLIQQLEDYGIAL